ncbi:MAG: tyrosine--tRNA ligase [Candidatus Bipolaricaulota bacterium]
MDVKTEVERQLAEIERATEVVVPREELTAKLERSLNEQRPLRVKLGIDPSAPHLTYGHAVVLRKLRAFQDLGHMAVLVVGDFTRRVGDPSGRARTRDPMTPEDIQRNMATYREQAFRILDPERTEVRYNSEWLGNLSLEDVIVLSAKYTVARMLEREDFHRRYKDGIPITIMEFLYPLAQAYDSVAIHADVELGGSDQRVNLLIARDIQEGYGQAPQAVVTMPLLLGPDGQMSMSQSRGNYIGIDEPPEEQFGKVMSIPDALLGDYTRLLTDLSWEKLAAMHPKLAKKHLARTLVAAFQGTSAADAAQAHFERVFEQQESPEEMTEVQLDPALLDGDGKANVIDLIMAAELAPSRSQARRLVEQGGVEVAGRRAGSPNEQVPASAGTVLRVGRRKFARIKEV